MKNLKQVTCEIKENLFDNKNCDLLNQFKEWGEDGNSFVLTDKNGDDYRITVTKETPKREGEVFAFKTNELEKCWEYLPKGTIFAKVFETPREGYFVGDEVIFVKEDYSDVIFKNLFEIKSISENKKSFTFKTTGAMVNVHNAEKLNSLLKQLKAEE